jgi:hypothetical protein
MMPLLGGRSIFNSSFEPLVRGTHLQDPFGTIPPKPRVSGPNDPTMGFRFPPVLKINEAGIAVPQDPPPFFGPQPDLGRLSADFEAPRRGGAEISSGRGDRGGVSYGAYQMSAKAKTPEDFLKTEGRSWAGRFKTAKPGTPDFDRTWLAINREDPVGFNQAQQAYVHRKYYQPNVRSTHAATKLNLDARSRAVREAVLSTSVQNSGGAAMILRNAVRVADAMTARSSPDYDRVLLRHLYGFRSDHVSRQAGVMLKSPDPARREQGRQLENVVKNRYVAELAKALRMLDEEQKSHR